MINWKYTTLTEPPLTKRLSDSQLKELVKEGVKSSLWNSAIFNLPNHTQAVERTVKLVTEASVKVAGNDRRDGYIRNVHAKLCPNSTIKVNFAIIDQYNEL